MQYLLWPLFESRGIDSFAYYYSLWGFKSHPQSSGRTELSVPAYSHADIRTHSDDLPCCLSSSP